MYGEFQLKLFNGSAPNPDIKGKNALAEMAIFKDDSINIIGYDRKQMQKNCKESYSYYSRTLQMI